MAPARTEPSAVSESRPGLRERKKIKTRQAIRKAAYRLFGEQGYAATSVERIAEEAEVSPSTVFRYFPTKEDIVLTDEYDPLMHDALLARPADEPPVTALRKAMLEVIGQSMRQEPGREPAEAHQRIRLVLEVPALRARMTEQMSQTVRMLAEALAGRTGRDADTLELRVCTGALVGAMSEAMFFWAGSDEPEEDLFAVVERALRVVERGIPQALGAQGAGTPPGPQG
ncbi:TetR/AcrR family transcriptional regulator [Streptomyces sp. WMMB 322]|uniref:TetR/AcrR family transcriptional regulator n=1 Tax=Streptomyces sp. WMMB 322 TaxID=1286821 RepID=UPI0006E349C8|nr:TetR family transcriptional regulator [Streptomyces sp. WMMB 322]